MTDIKIMQKLIEYGYEKMEKNNAYPFCAFIVRDGEIVSKGFNYKVQLTKDKTGHGEVEALKKACASLKIRNPYDLGSKYELFSTCEPCLACLDAINRAGIRKIVMAVDHTDFPEYFHEHPYTIDEFKKDNKGTVKIVKGVEKESAVRLFNKAKEKYGW